MNYIYVLTLSATLSTGSFIMSADPSEWFNLPVTVSRESDLIPVHVYRNSIAINNFMVSSFLKKRGSLSFDEMKYDLETDILKEMGSKMTGQFLVLRQSQPDLYVQDNNSTIADYAQCEPYQLYFIVRPQAQ